MPPKVFDISLTPEAFEALRRLAEGDPLDGNVREIGQYDEAQIADSECLDALCREGFMDNVLSVQGWPMDIVMITDFGRLVYHLLSGKTWTVTVGKRDYIVLSFPAEKEEADE